MGLRDKEIMQGIISRGTTYAPFTGSGLSESVTRKLNQQMTAAKKTQLQVGAAKAVSGLISIQQMRQTEREMKTLDIDIRKTRHGKVIPVLTQTQRYVQAQGQILTGAQQTAGETVVNLGDESAHGALMDLKVAGLYDEIAEMKDNPIIEYRDPPTGGGLFDWFKLPDFGGKIAKVFAGVGIGLIIIVGIVAVVLFKGKR